MNRRGLLGLLGLGVAAGPSVAGEMMNKTSYPSPGILGTQGGNIEQAVPWDPVEQLAYVRKEYDLMVGDQSRYMAERISGMYYDYINGYASYNMKSIDPDIRNMKSFSESAKIRMHIERRVKRDYESTKNNLWDRIQKLLKEV
jgi:hypothetical protein